MRKRLTATARATAHGCAVIALAFTLGCRSNDVLDTSGVGSQPITITVVPATATVQVGAAQQFGVSLQPTPPDPRVSWSVVDSVTASIDASGRLTALSPGKTTVTATLLANPVMKGAAQVQVTP